MESSAVPADSDWGKLAAQEESAREPQMHGRYQELAALAEEERQQRLLSMAKAEYALPNEVLVPFSKSRLNVFLSLDRDAAQTVAKSYDSVMQKLPGEAAMRRVSIVQSLALQFSAEEEERLRELIPNIFSGAAGHRDVARSMAETLAVAEPSRKKPFWAFWRK